MKLFPTTIQQQTFSLIVNFTSMAKYKLLIPMTISATQLNSLPAYEQAIEADLPSNLAILKGVNKYLIHKNGSPLHLELRPVLGNKHPIRDPDYLKLLQLNIG